MSYKRVLPWIILIGTLAAYLFIMDSHLDEVDEVLDQENEIEYESPKSGPQKERNQKFSKVEQKKSPAQSLVKVPKKVPKEIEDLRQMTKANLGGAFTAFHASKAEFGRFSTDFMTVGFEPHFKELPFKLGFLEAYWPEKLVRYETIEETPDYMTSDAWVNFDVNESGYKYASPEVEDIDLSQFSSFCKMGCTAGEDYFELMSAFLVDNETIEVWTIDHKKRLRSRRFRL